MHFAVGNADKCGDIAPQVQQGVHLHGSLALSELCPREQREGTGRWWSSPARTDSDPGPRRSGRGRTRAARCESRPGRNRHRSASRAIRWRRPVWSAPPGSRIPCGRAWRRANAGTLRYRGGFRGRSTGRTPSIGTDPSRRSCAICDPRRSGLRSGGTHDPEGS